MTSTQAGPNYSSRSVQRVCDILDTLADAPMGANLTEVAQAAELPKSSALRYLTVLEERSYVERGADRTVYRLGPAFRGQTDGTRERLIMVARPVLERLRDELRETVNLGVLEGTYVVHELVLESPEMMRLAARPGERGLIHCTALGKALSATLPIERVKTIIDTTGLPAATSATITTVDRLWTELEHVRELGYAVDEAENQEDGRCIAVAIPRLPLSAGVSVSAPATRLPRSNLSAVARKLAAAAAMISRHFNG